VAHRAFRAGFGNGAPQAHPMKNMVNPGIT
jgi:hypothetical protein